MEEGAQEILQGVLEKADNDIIYLAVALTVGLFIVFIPFYFMMLRDRKERRAAEAQREKDKNNAQVEHDRIIIQVVTANTEAMTRNTEAITSLKAAIDDNSKAYNASLERIHERIDDIKKVNSDIQHDVKQILQTVDKDTAAN